MHLSPKPGQADGILAITTARHKDMLPGKFLSQKAIESRPVAVPGTPRLVLDDIEVDRFVYLHVSCRTRLMVSKFSLLPFIRISRGWAVGWVIQPNEH